VINCFAVVAVVSNDIFIKHPLLKEAMLSTLVGVVTNKEFQNETIKY
jgi:hypothetical protein